MAVVNLTRKKQFARKLQTSYAVFELEFADVITSADNYELGVLPPEAIIQDAYGWIFEVSNVAVTASAVVGTTAGGSEILSAIDLDAATGKVGTYTGNSDVGTGKTVFYTPTYDQAQTQGKITIVIEYLEYQKHSDELTNFSATA